MYQTVEAVVGFPFTFIWYIIAVLELFCGCFADHTSETGSQSTSNIWEPEESSRDHSNIEVVTQSGKQLESIQNENDALKKQVAHLRAIVSKLTGDNKNLDAKLQASYAEKHIVMEAKEAASSLAEKHLATINLLKPDLELANQIICEKMRVIKQQDDDLSDLKKLNANLDRQNSDTKISKQILEDSVRKRQSDWRSTELKLEGKNASLKQALANLETETQKLLETNNLVKSELESANEEIANLRNNIDNRESMATELSPQIEILCSESEKMMKSCEAASLPAQQAEQFTEEQKKMQNQLNQEKSKAAKRTQKSALGKLSASFKAAQAALKDSVADAKKVAGVQKNDESGDTADPTQTKADIIKKPGGSQIKRWLKSHSFKSRKIPQKTAN